MSESKANKVEEALKLRTGMEELASKIDEQGKINAQLSTQIGLFLNKKLSLDESTQEEIKSLKTALNGVSIPSEIRVIKSMKIEEVAKKFLFWWGGSSFLVSAFCIWFAVSAQKDYREPTKLEQEQRVWYHDYVMEMKEKNPKTHDTFLVKKPFPN